MIRRPPRSTLSSSSAASDVYKRQDLSRAQTREAEQNALSASNGEERRMIASYVKEAHRLREALESVQNSSVRPDPAEQADVTQHWLTRAASVGAAVAECEREISNLKHVAEVSQAEAAEARQMAAEVVAGEQEVAAEYQHTIDSQRSLVVALQRDLDEAKQQIRSDRASISDLRWQLDRQHEAAVQHMQLGQQHEQLKKDMGVTQARQEKHHQEAFSMIVDRNDSLAAQQREHDIILDQQSKRALKQQQQLEEEKRVLQQTILEQKKEIEALCDTGALKQHNDQLEEQVRELKQLLEGQRLMLDSQPANTGGQPSPKAVFGARVGSNDSSLQAGGEWTHIARDQLAPGGDGASEGEERAEQSELEAKVQELQMLLDGQRLVNQMAAAKGTAIIDESNSRLVAAKQENEFLKAKNKELESVNEATRLQVARLQS
eukprot:TRINITY_DN45185_c0_g1_i1.p1 TRINITY_DN45185_c0_g1~~TRINITY_DN45185_c0_g1_i1.p1  ORF type:complete len:434 (+),score=152.41 TRINITY_DN45185_c0_g1_i1:88-1389(+)